MASKAVAKEQGTDESKSTALVTTAPSALALAKRDDLAEILGGEELGVTGLEETDASDFRLAGLVFNFGGVAADGQQIPKNVFFHTIDETTTPKKKVALLVLHKSHSYSKFDQAANKTKVICSSWDRVVGRMDDGTERKCNGCPDREWRVVEGKRTRNCGEVHNVVAMDRERGEPVMFRFKRTAMKPWTTYLNKHFLGKRVIGGRPGNYPLFMYETLMSLKLEKNGSTVYAVPEFARGDVLSADEIRFHAESARGFRELYLDRVREVAEATEAHDDNEGALDTSFNPDRFADDGAEAGESKRF